MYLPKLLAKAARGEKLVALTCYDASFARLMVRCGIDILLVGDSLGMTVQGHASTLPVTLEQMVYHTAAVARGAAGEGLILADLPFGSYQGSASQAFDSAARLLAAGANMVKLEGGQVMAATVRFLVERGIPVCGHLGLMPQSVNRTGYAPQGRDPPAAERLLEDAERLAEAGAQLLVLESIPAQLAQEVTRRLAIPTIGIGAGPHCGGQVLVLHDVLGLTPSPPRFARDFLTGAPSLEAAIAAYAEAVRTGTFPGPEHCL
ncbi:MAG: 3-methyl-2-oxobutanoate hydroxymethyltransferase [Thiobacillaceae bacterium]|nr:3-methyl-2-oxobutanoate hydroxymethyltransferase [Thiobacillaceae bacterium]MCX7672860.1 3-methyl-2-oxobutanoate hydroxymethyltransferase [Thiobacillaceae bacterium]MDW8324764.1 3-methyl-2-oxobutanoate hydroxymethyltransferase [Burkholderiales bacterium]